MDLKKSKKANLENNRNLLLLIGLVVSLGFVLLMFEWTTKPTQTNSLGYIQVQEVEEEIIPITRQDEVKPPPPPPPPTVVEVLNIVDDDVEIEDELEIEDTEADDETIIDVAPIIETAEEEEEDEAQIFYIVEEMPEFPGGELALRKFLANSVKYPVIAQENGIQGKVYITFVVGTDGNVKNIKISRGVDPALDKEALRVVGESPRWRPGKQRGRAVNVSYTVPINFVLQ